MMNCCPSCCESLAAIGRAKVSVPPPAGKGLTMMDGLVGQLCPCAANVQNAIATIAINLDIHVSMSAPDEVGLFLGKKSLHADSEILRVEAGVGFGVFCIGERPRIG